METTASKRDYYGKLLYTRIKLTWIPCAVLLAALFVIDCIMLSTYSADYYEPSLIEYYEIGVYTNHIVMAVVCAAICIALFNRLVYRHSYSVNADKKNAYLIDLTMITIAAVSVIAIELLTPILVKFFAYLALADKGLIGGNNFAPNYLMEVIDVVMTTFLSFGLAYAVMRSFAQNILRGLLTLAVIIAAALVCLFVPNLILRAIEKNGRMIVESVYTATNMSVFTVLTIASNVFSYFYNKKADFVR